MPTIPQSSSSSFEAFPQDKQDKLARAQAEKLKSVAHLPKKVNIPGFPNQVPVMTPVSNEAHAPQQVRQSQRPGDTGVRIHQPPPVNIGNFDASAAMKADLMFSAFNARAPQAAPIPEPMSQVPNVTPGFTQAIADAESMSLALPSRFAFYGFKDFYARPLLAKHIAKLQKAHREQSLLPVVEAVSSVCFTTDERYAGVPLAFDLTLPDFFFVLYWLRLNSFTKSNYIHTTKCDNKEHVERVEYTLNMDRIIKAFNEQKITEEEFQRMQREALPKESLDISQLITQTDMKVNELETVPDPDIFHFSDSSAIIMRPPTMRDVLELAEAPQMRNPETRAEFAFLASLASHIQHRELQLSLEQRVDIIGNATGDQMQLVKDFEKALKGYGVEEKIRVQCKECGAARETKLSVAAHSFLPSI